MDRKIQEIQEGAGRPSMATTDDNIERVRDVGLLDRRLTVDGVANRLQIMKNKVIISSFFIEIKFLSGRPRRRWEDNIKFVLQEVGGGCATGWSWLLIGTGGGQL
jgi:hypothetical protein